MGVPRTILLGAKGWSNPRRSKRQGARSTVLVLCPTTRAARCAGTASSTLLVKNKRSTSLIFWASGRATHEPSQQVVSALRVSVVPSLALGYRSMILRIMQFPNCSRPRSAGAAPWILANSRPTRDSAPRVADPPKHAGEILRPCTFAKQKLLGPWTSAGVRVPLDRQVSCRSLS